MRDSTLSSVLLPAPFAPTIPMTSPTPTRNVTSLSAQKVFAWRLWPPIWRKRRHGPAAHEVSDSPSVRSPIGVAPIVYCLPSRSTTMASDDIGEPALHLQEVAHASGEHSRRGERRDDDDALRKRAAQDAGAEPRDHPCHRVQRVERVPFLRDDLEVVQH